MSTKKTLEEIRQSFENVGYKLVSTNYINAHTKLKYICSNGHTGMITWNDFQQGSRCRVCSYIKRGRDKRLSIVYVRQKFEESGYSLLSTEYKNSNQKLDYICPKGHKGSISWADFQQGYRCKICGISKASAKRRLSLEYIKQKFEAVGYKLLSTEYKNNRQKLKFICSEGHEGSITYGNFFNGERCAKCIRAKNGANRKLSIDYIKEKFEDRGYTLLSKEYKNNKQNLKYICSEGHYSYITWSNFLKGQGCKKCSKGTSKAEQEIFDFIKQYFEDSYQHDRKLIPPYELDIVIPSKKIAVEYCGLYWHSEQAGKDKNYHYNKYEKCREVGYRLITIFEDEWEKHKDIVLSRLANILSISGQEIIFARKCDIREISTKLKNEFLDNNHIQGRDKSKIKIGAFSEDRLVSVMTFSIPSIAKGGKTEEGVFELNRFCSEKGIVCTGIASRMFKYFVTNYSPKEVFSYADIRWSKGDLYKKLGFNFVGRSNPNYWYIDGQDRIHRFNFRKSVLEKKLDNFSENLTEVENMVNNGFTRIWDCGNLKFVKCLR